MEIFINANEGQEADIREGIAISGSLIHFSRSMPADEDLEADIFFILDVPGSSLDFSIFHGKPVYINEVVHTLEELRVPANVSRINGWPGFLKREVWEVATASEDNTADHFNMLNRKAEFVADIPGFVAARVVCMIINEAFYALSEGVSSREEIDLAMKTGTNYPRGPFEWADIIGKQNVHDLLNHLYQSDPVYQPAFKI